MYSDNLPICNSLILLGFHALLSEVKGTIPSKGDFYAPHRYVTVSNIVKRLQVCHYGIRCNPIQDGAKRVSGMALIYSIGEPADTPLGRFICIPKKTKAPQEIILKRLLKYRLHAHSPEYGGRIVYFVLACLASVFS